MKLIEPAQSPVEKDRIQLVIDRIGKLLQFGNTDEQAESALLARFMRGLDNRFVMFRNLRFGSAGEVFPPILVGPSGLILLNVSLVKGFFRAKDDSWWE